MTLPVTGCELVLEDTPAEGVHIIVSIAKMRNDWTEEVCDGEISHYTGNNYEDECYLFVNDQDEPQWDPNTIDIFKDDENGIYVGINNETVCKAVTDEDDEVDVAAKYLANYLVEKHIVNDKDDAFDAATTIIDPEGAIEELEAFGDGDTYENWFYSIGAGDVISPSDEGVVRGAVFVDIRVTEVTNGAIDKNGIESDASEDAEYEEDKRFVALMQQE